MLSHRAVYKVCVIRSPRSLCILDGGDKAPIGLRDGD
jgi:hypothetical protein